jgi:hypothetical protein
VVKSIDAGLLEALRGTRAVARAPGTPGARPETITLSVDATLLGAASEKEGAAGNYKGGFGFHPLHCYLDETGEPLAGLLRPGNAGSNTAADHFEVLQLPLEQLPDADLDREILVRTDIGGCTHAFTRDCREADIRFSVGYEVDERVCEGAWVTELTDRLDLSPWPEGTRLSVRREPPIPGRSSASLTQRVTATPPSSPTRRQPTSRPWSYAIAAAPKSRTRSAAAMTRECAALLSPPSSTTESGWSSR